MWRRQIARNIMLCLLAAILFFPPSQAALNELESPDNIQCACVGDVLMFTCTIVGGGNTLWRGSAFDCESTSDEIILRHSTFGSTGTSGTCNSGTIVGQSVRVEGTCFTSRLNVSISESLNSRVVQCDYNSNRGTTNIGSASLNVVSASNPYPPPNDVRLISTDFKQRLVTFNWTLVSSSCPSIDYVITSDCGVCPSSTNSTTVTCSDLQLPTRSDDSVCSFNVSSRVCGIVGDHITTILTAAVPDVPRVLSMVPLYANESQSLKRLTLTIDTTNNTRISTNDLSGSIKEYNVTYSKRSTLVNSTIIPAESLSCKDDVCNFTVTVPSSVCSSSSNIDVTVSAANRIGQGPSSDTAIIDCTNMFVQVNFNSSTSIFSCEFLNKFDNSVKSCKIVYGLCNQELINKVEEKSTPGNPNIVLLYLPDLKGQVYCYTVTTSSNISTIRIEGKLEGAKVRVKSDNLALILAIAIPVVIITLCLTSILVVVLFAIVMKRKNGGLEIIPVSYSQLQTTASDPLELQLKPVEKKRDIVVYKVDENCELRGFMKKKGSEVNSWRGCVYYELTEEKEDISSDKELILMKKNTEELYTPENDKETLHKLGLLGEGISQPSLETPIGSQYRVFVQSKGAGRRHLRTGTLLLFEKEKYSEKFYEPQFLPIPEDYFVVQNITEETTIKDLFKMHKLGTNKSNIFIEFDKSQVERKDVRDVLLLDKEKEKLFTGPCTQQMIKENSVIDPQKWSVFVLRKSDESFKLKNGMTVVYENPKNVTGTFRLLEVDEENVRMSEFVRRKLEINEFERGRAYFEFTEKEDLPCCRKVIRMPAGKAKKDYQELQATIETFYTISGTPGDEISPPELKTIKTFIHSPTLGSRCLKKGTLLLYRVKESEVDVPAKEHIKNANQTVKNDVTKSEEDKAALSDSKQDSNQALDMDSGPEHATLPKQVGVDTQPMAGSQRHLKASKAKDHKQVKENLPQVKAHDRKETSVDTPKDGSTATVSGKGTKSGSA